MNRPNHDSTTRRDWIARCARGSILAGLAAIGFRLLGRDPNTNCTRPAEMCRDCGLLAHCEAECAENARRTTIP